MPAPRSREGHIVLLLSVRTYVSGTPVTIRSSILVSATPLTVFDRGLKLATLFMHVHKGNRTLIHIIIAELCPIE